MRILIVNSIYPTPGAPKVIGGAEIFARQFAEALVARGNEVEVVRAASRPQQEIETCNEAAIYSAPARNIYPPFSAQPAGPLRGIWHVMDDWSTAAPLVTDRINSFRPDVLHTNTLSGLTTGVWVAAHKSGVPIVHTLHDYYLTCPRCSRFSNGRTCTHTCLSCRLLTVNRRKNTAYVNAIVGVSQRVLDIHTEQGLFEQARLRTVIRNASLTDSLPPPRNKTKNQKPTFGFIGRLTEEKGIFNLIRAFAKIPADVARLVIAGRASESEQRHLRSMAPSAHIEFLGFVKPASFYEMVDVVIAPSIWEDPAPLVLVESWAAGRPVLGTPFGGIGEVIEPGVNGWITLPDSTSLADSISRIAKDPETTFAMTDALAAKSKRRSLADVVTSYYSVFESVAKKATSV